MATYVIGDIHGCYQTLLNLLDEIDYRPQEDRIWLVGDLVNNGPRNAQVIRWAMAQGDRLVCVLGNHDLHMLAASRSARKIRKKDTFQDVLDAPDREELLSWMRQRPLLHVEGQDVMVHAGLLPEWDLEVASSCAREVERALRDDARYDDFFSHMYGNEPRAWAPGLDALDRMRLTVNAMTRMRVLDVKDQLEFKYKGTLDAMPEQLSPWFERVERLGEARVFFGHWSAVGYHREGNIHALDAGVTWGRALMAMRLEDEARYQVPTAPGEAAGSL